MIDVSISTWLPNDIELTNFYTGINDFVKKYVDVESAKKYAHKKVIIDPCVGYIDIQPWETTLLDTHIYQRLRKITQLGLAYMVFPTLRYSRFEHTLGVLGRLDQMLKKLREKHKDNESVFIDLIDKYETRLRLAALFHDLGHCLYSHLSESVINNIVGNETVAKDSDEYYPSAQFIKEAFKKKFKTALSIAEIFSITMMASSVFVDLLKEAGIRSKLIGEEKSSIDKLHIPEILGDTAHFIAGIPVYDRPETIFMAQLISSGLDADKLDYMSREEHFSGIKVEMDLDRILNKIKVKSINNKKGLQSGLEKYSRHISENNPSPYYILCIERGGQFAYEEFCVARLALYEKIYLHKKVRASEQFLKNELQKLPRENEAFNKAHAWLYLPENIVENGTTVSAIQQQKIIVNTELTLFGKEEKIEKKDVPVTGKLNIDFSFIEKRLIPHRAFAFGPANATYDNDYFSLLDSAKKKEEIESEIQKLLSVKFWEKLKTKEGTKEFIEKIKSELFVILDLLLENKTRTPNHTINDLTYFRSKIENLEFESSLIIDVPDYKRVVLSFETLYFEESSFQFVRWTIPIHRISHYYQLHRILAYIYYDKKYCDIIYLACERAVLGFLGSTPGFRQFYEQEHLISKDIYESAESLKKSIIAKDPSFYDDYKELAFSKKSLNDEYTSSIISDLRQEINRYNTNKFDYQVTHQDVINYIHQFPKDIQDIILEILSSVKVLHESALEPILKALFTEIRTNSPEDKINVIGLGAASSSGSGMLKHVLGVLDKHDIATDNLNAETINKYDHFVLFDDNTNSGRQALNIIARWCNVNDDILYKANIFTDTERNRDAKFINATVADKLRSDKTKITLCFITGTEDAEIFLKLHLKETIGIQGKIDIKIRYYLTEDSNILNDRRPPDDDNIFNVIKQKFLKKNEGHPIKAINKTRDFLIDIGSQLVKEKDICKLRGEDPKKHALGYCNRASTIIFPNSVPTSVITALWCRGKYTIKDKTGAEIEKEWIPLIARDKH
jgi:HD superfamily phosphohydrolase